MYKHCYDTTSEKKWPGFYPYLFIIIFLFIYLNETDHIFKFYTMYPFIFKDSWFGTRFFSRGFDSKVNFFVILNDDEQVFFQSDCVC